MNEVDAVLLSVAGFGAACAYLRQRAHSAEQRAKYRAEFYGVANELLDMGRDLPAAVAADLDKMVRDIESPAVAWLLFRALGETLRGGAAPHYRVDMPDTKAQRLRYVARVLFFLTLSYRRPLLGVLIRAQLAKLLADPAGVEARRTFNRTLDHDAVA